MTWLWVLLLGCGDSLCPYDGETFDTWPGRFSEVDLPVDENTGVCGVTETHNSLYMIRRGSDVQGFVSEVTQAMDAGGFTPVERPADIEAKAGAVEQYFVSGEVTPQVSVISAIAFEGKIQLNLRTDDARADSFWLPPEDFEAVQTAASGVLERVWAHVGEAPEGMSPCSEEPIPGFQADYHGLAREFGGTSTPPEHWRELGGRERQAMARAPAGTAVAQRHTYEYQSLLVNKPVLVVRADSWIRPEERPESGTFDPGYIVGFAFSVDPEQGVLCQGPFRASNADLAVEGNSEDALMGGVQRAALLGLYPGRFGQ